MNRCKMLTGAGVALSLSLLAGCGGGTQSQSTGASAGAACPQEPVRVVVSVNQWADIVKQLGGSCTDVTTVIANAAADPHDYEPTAADIARLGDAQLVVVNGADYDTWATKAVDALPQRPPVVDAGKVTGVTAGSNPHIWYSPTYVTDVADAVGVQLQQLLPQSQEYLDTQKQQWTESMKPYFQEVAAIKNGAGGKTYGATEGVFDYMAAAVGLTDLTPTGYQRAAAAESDPSPGDIQAFEQALADKKINVLIYNTQTEGAIPEQIRAAADSAGVPVVDVTETVPADQPSFESWQTSQLRDLASALGVQG